MIIQLKCHTCNIQETLDIAVQDKEDLAAIFVYKHKSEGHNVEVIERDNPRELITVSHPTQYKGVNFEKDRDAALLSLNKFQIQAFCIKYGIDIARSEDKFWIGVHRSRVNLFSLPEKAREESRQWLKKRGFK